MLPLRVMIISGGIKVLSTLSEITSVSNNHQKIWFFKRLLTQTNISEAKDAAQCKMTMTPIFFIPIVNRMLS